MMINENTVIHAKEALENLEETQIHGCEDCDKFFENRFDADRTNHGLVIDVEKGIWSIAVGCEGYFQGRRS